MSARAGYRLLRSSASAAEFHARPVPDPPRCEIWQHDITAPALVLGSSQDASIVDRAACRRAGIDLVRRRSGGGAVLLVPGAVTWVDVIVPVGTVGWSNDVHGPMVWLGRVVADAISSLLGSAAGIEVHEGAMRTTPWSASICFDGLGAGEVLLDGGKLVGISQRRTRSAARLQCCWYSDHDAGLLVSLLDERHRPPVAALAPVATVPAELAGAIVDVLADRLA